ncbi:PAS domain S-box protein (plasmid) [Haloferax mediterranei ATCC 33500]|uniref:Bacterio-opsin activator-like protein n=1 Tax=Haloferax mediterranei (strain ATCC 33500 / DSM 1411 / JCM 8866 / NBRC 14739 / NCIMB 2177 / R-4) TaxID=523841 RepID=I3RBE7_HALMT|nr:PAS domain S-box protein [Haloferax mediterranei]AFK21557.1 bacterio-opsin activator-like protein [Haloferax mediterranei ATCC 33500]AHZ24394.1 transcriptional regulator [Haloferax mediterranei ATCC 33500]ELZ97134.1 bacterio-opsin activator-like protein [Haloferax mediterranei ATCC 33500]MDX5990123.1 PAS domain S-box protein [Haloferax mediterranei ATCC 33500]QCQ76794.1 PAS domain S-box protein [Haloferax mediterranei ATCC 33500]
MPPASTFDESFFQEVVFSPGEGILSIDDGGVVVFTSQPIERILGYGPDELVGGPVDRLFPPEHEDPLETIRREAKRASTGVDDTTTNITLVHADGRNISVDFSADSTEYDETRFFTLRIRAWRVHEDQRPPPVVESRPPKANRRFPQKVFRHSNEAILVFDTNSDEIVECNPRACERFGYSREELLSFSPSNLYSDEEAFTAFIEEVLEDGSSWTNELNCRASDGETFPTEISATLLYVDGEPHVLVFARDVSERREQQREVEQYRTIVEAVGEGIYAADDEFRFTVVNEGTAELTGYTKDELIGTPLTHLLAGEVDQVDRSEYEALLTGERYTVVDAESARTARDELLESDRGVMRVEAPIYTKDGEIVPLEIRFSELPTEPDGDFQGTTGVLIDVSEHKEYERRLGALNGASQELTQATDRDAIAWAALNAVERILGFDVSCIRTFNSETNSLEPTAVTDAARQLIDVRPAFDLEVTLAGRAYRNGESIVHQPSSNESFSGDEASLHLPLGRHGTLSVFTESADGFTEADVQIAEVLSATVTSHFERAERERELQKSEAECRDQRDQLDTLNRINALVQNLIGELIEAGMRETIEERVCQQLAASSLYEYAWIAEVGVTGEDVVVKTGAGIEEGYLDALDNMSVSQLGKGTVEQAIETGEINVVRQYLIEDEADDADELEVTAAVALQYGARVYGVLVVNATREDAFSKQAQAGLEVLGDAIGFTINAIQSKELLLSDEIVELEFTVSDARNVPVYFSEKLGCRCRLEGTTLNGEGNYLCYIRVEGTSVEDALEVADRMDSITDARLIQEHDNECLLEVVRAESVPDAMIDIGASIRSADADNGEGTVILEAPQTADIRKVVQAFQSFYPDSELVAKREVDRSVQTAAEFRDEVDDRLTDKQRMAAKSAYYAGYFDWPRESTAEDVAELMGISSATFHQHIRKAERKLMASLFGDTHEHSE